MAYTTIDDPSAYFTITLYTGNGNDNRAITNSANAGNFQPDWLWYKERDGTSEHRSFDSSRGNSQRLEPNNTNAEATDSTNHQSFDSNGFTIGNSGSTNENTKTYVAWQWKANGGTTASNSNGSITTTVQANTTAGFSIVLYTSASGGQTIGHGLGVAPDMYWIKKRNAAGDDWFVYHSALGEGKKQRLSGNSAAENDTNIWQNTAPTTTVASLQNDGGGVNVSTGGTKNYIGYFFNSVQGYSKIGSYKGNGNADGTFVYTGFTPAWLLTKDTGSTEQWQIKDTTRFPKNPNYYPIFANLANVEGNNTNSKVDFLSNGFKIRNNDGGHNTSGNEYIYMAFAEHPFVSSEGVPAPAR